MNGNGHDQTARVQPQLPPQMQRMTPQEQARFICENWCFNVMKTTMAGCLQLHPHMSPPEVVQIMSRCYGKLVGTLFAGALLEVLNNRRTCREEFNKALDAEPIPSMPDLTPPAAPPPGMGGR